MNRFTIFKRFAKLQLGEKFGRLILSVFIVLFMLMFSSQNEDFIPKKSIDRIIYDFYLKYDVIKTGYIVNESNENNTVINNHYIDDDIVIADIDEHSMAKEGRFPWLRIKFAKLNEQLINHYKARLVGYDIVFSETSENSGSYVLQQISNKEREKHDAFLNEMKKHKKSIAKRNIQTLNKLRRENEKLHTELVSSLRKLSRKINNNKKNILHSAGKTQSAIYEDFISLVASLTSKYEHHKDTLLSQFDDSKLDIDSRTHRYVYNLINELNEISNQELAQSKDKIYKNQKKIISLMKEIIQAMYSSSGKSVTLLERAQNKNHKNITSVTNDTFLEYSKHNNEVLKNIEKIYESDYQSFLGYKEKLYKEIDYDYFFADSMRNKPFILGFLFTQSWPGQPIIKTNSLPLSAINLDEGVSYALWPYNYSGYVANLPLFSKVVSGSGHMNFVPDEDGNVRRVPMLIHHEGNLYQSLSLAMYRQLMGNPPVSLIPSRVKTTSDGQFMVGAVQIGGRSIPVDPRLRALIPYKATSLNFKYVSVTRILNGTADPEDLKDKIILVGTSAAGLQDLRSAPIDSNYPGVEIHATMLSAMLGSARPTWDNSDIKSVEYDELFVQISIFLSGIIMVIVTLFFTARWTIISSLILLCSNISLSMYAWFSHNTYFPPGSAIILIITLYIIHVTVNAVRSNKIQFKSESNK